MVFDACMELIDTWHHTEITWCLAGIKAEIYENVLEESAKRGLHEGNMVVGNLRGSDIQVGTSPKKTARDRPLFNLRSTSRQ
jgi:hypothetical protein